MNELLGYVVRQFAAVAVGEDLQHHVQRGGSPRAGVAIAVDQEDFRGDPNARKLVGERGQAFPVQAYDKQLDRIKPTSEPVTAAA